jgi:hypothetical protein
MMTKGTEQQAKDGRFDDEAYVDVDGSDQRYVKRGAMTTDHCKRRLAFIEGKDGYDAEREWLRQRIDQFREWDEPSGPSFLERLR